MHFLSIMLVSSVLVCLPLLVSAHPPQQSAVTALQNKVKALENKVKQLGQRRGGPVGDADLYEVIDSQGLTVGTTAGLGCCENFTSVIGTFGGRKVLLNVNRSLLLGQDHVLFFLTGDCSGRAYNWAVGQLIPVTIIGGPNLTLYVPNGQPEVITAGSIAFLEWPDGDNWHNPTWTCNADVSWISWPKTLVPVDPLLDLGPLFVPPFRVQ